MSHNKQKAEIQQAVRDINQIMKGTIPHCDPAEMINLTDIVRDDDNNKNHNINRLYEVIYKLLEQLEKFIVKNNNADYTATFEEIKIELKDFIKNEIKRQILTLIKKQS